MIVKPAEWIKKGCRTIASTVVVAHENMFRENWPECLIPRANSLFKNYSKKENSQTWSDFLKILKINVNGCGGPSGGSGGVGASGRAVREGEGEGLAAPGGRAAGARGRDWRLPGGDRTEGIPEGRRGPRIASISGCFELVLGVDTRSSRKNNILYLHYGNPCVLHCF